jgi:hypothetical protein
MQSLFSYSRLIGLGTGLAIIPLSLHADDSGDNDWNHFGMNFRAGFNASAKFSESGSGAGGGFLPPGPGAGSALNHQYSDGFVDVDRSGNQGGKTWNWSYKNASQVGDDVIDFHDTASVGSGSDRKSDDPNYGVDFNYVRDILHAKWGQLGIKIGFGYTPIDIHDNTPLGANTETITDEYALGGVIPPGAPYTGSFNGPGPVISSQPDARTVSEAAGGMSLGNRRLDVSLYDFRLGPTVNIPIYKRFSVQAGGGVVMGIADSEFDYVEFGAPGTPSVTGNSSHTGLNLGAYGELGFAFKLSSSTSLFTGAQYEYLGNFNQSSSGHSAELDLGSTIFYEFGLQWHF